MGRKTGPSGRGRQAGRGTHRPEPSPKGADRFVQIVAAHPVRWAIIAYVALTVVFFVVPLFSPGKMIYGTDSMSAGVFFRTFAADFWRSHLRMPLWDPYIHGGLPYVDAMHGDMFYPAAILQILLPVTYALGLKLILHVFLAGVFMFLFLRCIGRSDLASFIGGALYMFTPCLISLFYPGHDGKIYVMALTPLAFLAVHQAAVTRRLGAFLGFGLVYTLMILTAHVQMAFYASWGLGLYFLFLLWKEHQFTPRRILLPVLFFVVSVLLALGASAIQWMAPYRYLAKYSQRLQYAEGRGGYNWASSWSMNSEELLSEINPEFPGENLRGEPTTYWGQNYFKLNSEAVGVMAVALAIVAVTCASGPSIWFFGGLSILALLYALGDSTPVFRLFFYLVPMVKKFRAPSMINFLFAFSWIVMATRALDVLAAGGRRADNLRARRDPLRVLVIIAAVYTVITLIAVVSGRSLLTGWASLVGNPLAGGKAAVIAAAAPKVIAGFIYGMLTLWLLVGLFYWKRRGSLSPSTFGIGLAIIAVLPLWRFDHRFVQTVDPRPYYDVRPILQAIEKHAPDQPYRVFTLPKTIEDNYLALHGIEEISTTAMHGNQLLTYDNFVGRHDRMPALLSVPATMDLLNVAMVISPRPLNEPGFEVIDQSQGLYILKRTLSLPRAAVFYQYEVISDSNATLERLHQKDFPYRHLLILDQALPHLEPNRTADTSLMEMTPARIVDWDVDRFVVECTAERDGILWLSENYYPAWRATDENGKRLPVYRADYTFRAVPVTAGKHRITFEFHSEIFEKSAWLSLTCLLILAAGFGGWEWSRRRAIRSKETP